MFIIYRLIEGLKQLLWLGVGAILLMGAAHAQEKEKTIPGFDPEVVGKNLAKIFKIPEAKAGQILKSDRVVLRKKVKSAVAEKFAEGLRKAGLQIWIEPAEPLPPAVAGPTAPVPGHG